MLNTPEEVPVTQRVPTDAGNPRLAALVVAVLALLGVTAAGAVFVMVQSSSAEDDPVVLAGAVVFTAAMAVAIVLGALYPVWFVEPRAVRAVRGLSPDVRVWPGFRTSTLASLASVEHPTPLVRRVYFALDHRALTVWQREGDEVVAVFELPRDRIRSVTVELVRSKVDVGLGVSVTFGSADTPALVQLLPRRVRENSDAEARTLGAALAPTP